EEEPEDEYPSEEEPEDEHLSEEEPEDEYPGEEEPEDEYPGEEEPEDEYYPPYYVYPGLVLPYYPAWPGGHEEGTESNLRVSISAAGGPHYAGDEIHVYVSTEFSAPTHGIYGMPVPAYATVIIPIPNDRVIITDFNGSDASQGFDHVRDLSYRLIRIFINFRLMEFRLFGDDGTANRFIEYRAYEGATGITFTFMFPNGITYNETLVLMPESDYGYGTLGEQTMYGTTLNVQSSFGWDDADIVHGTHQGTASIIPPSGDSTSGTLDRNINYQIRARSQNSDSGSIFTREYVVLNTITFPRGVYVVGGAQDGYTWFDAYDNPIVQVEGEEDAVITPMPEDGRIVGFEIRLAKYNESYRLYRNGSIAATRLREIDNLDLIVNLFAENLNVDIPLFNTIFLDAANGTTIENRIRSEVTFTALPVVGSAEHVNRSQTYTVIPILQSSISARLTSETESPVPAGELIEYTIEIENTGWGDQFVEVVGIIPTWTTFYDADPGFEPRDNEDDPVVWNLMLRGQESVSLTFWVRVNNDIRDGVNITGNVTVDGRPLSISHATPVANLEFSLSADREMYEMVRIGDSITYTITVTNTGLGHTVVAVSSLIPTGTTLVSYSADAALGAASPGAHGLGWDLPLNAGATESISFTVIVNDDVANGFDISATARVNGTFTNMVTLRTPVANVEISKTGVSNNDFDDERVRPGDIISYTITLENTGEGNALVNVFNVIPSGVLPDANSFTATINGVPYYRIPITNQSTVSWRDIFMSAGDVIQLMFDVEVTTRVNNEVLNSRAILDVLGTESFSNTISHRIIVPELDFLLQANPPIGSTVSNGSVVTYTITVNNAGDYVGQAHIVASIPERTTLGTILVNGQLVNVANLTVTDEFIEYVVDVPAGESIDFSFQVTLGNMVDVYRLEQISYVNNLNTQMVYHVLPLPILGQGKSAVIKHLNDYGDLAERTNNVFEIEEGGSIIIFDPDLDADVDSRTITYVFEGDYITYTINVFNFGQGSGSVEIIDLIPYGTTLVDDFTHGGRFNPANRTLTWDDIVLDPATFIGNDEYGNPIYEPSTTSVSFRVRVNEGLRNGFNVANQASVNGQATNRVDFFLPMADVRIAQSAVTERDRDYIEIPNRPHQFQPVGLGEIITYTITLTNQGLADGSVRVRNQLPPGVMFGGIVDGPAPARSGTTSQTLTWNDVAVPALAGIDPDVPAVELVFAVEVFGEEEFQALVNFMMGRNPNDSGYGNDSGPIVNDPRDDGDFPRHPDGVNINDTEEIFNFAVLTDLLDGRNDMFSNTVRHMVVRPIFSFTLSADPEAMRNIEEVTLFGYGVEEGDTIYYFIDIANSGHDDGIAIIFSEIPALTELIRDRAYIVMLDEDGNEIDWHDEDGNVVRRVPISSDEYFETEGRGFYDKNGEWVYGVVFFMEVPARSVMRFAFAVEVGRVYDGFRIEYTAWVNRFRSRTIYHFSPIPRVTIAQSANRPYAHPRFRFDDSVPNDERRYQTLWPNGPLVPYPWILDENDNTYIVGMPSHLSNGVDHRRDGTGAFDPFGPTVVRPGERLTYYITLWSESSRSVVDVVSVLPLFVSPVADSIRIVNTASPAAIDINIGEITTSQDVVRYQGMNVPRYTINWNQVHLPRTTANMNAPVVLAVDVIVQVPPHTDVRIIDHYSKAMGNFRLPDGSYRAVDSITNRVEHIVIRSDSTFVKTGIAENRNDPFVQPGERIDYTLRIENSSTSAPDIFTVTDTLHYNLVDAFGSFDIRNTISAVILDSSGNIVSSVNTANPIDANRIFTSPAGSMNLPGLRWSYDSTSGTITWEGGLKPGERAELRFSAMVNPVHEEIYGDLVINQGFLNGNGSNGVIHRIVYRRPGSGGIGLTKVNNLTVRADGSLVEPNPGDIISYAIAMVNEQPITARNMVIEDRISRHTTFVEGSDQIIGGLGGFRYGGTDPDTELAFEPDDYRYNPDRYFYNNGYLAWVVHLGPYTEYYDYNSIVVTYDVEVNEQILEGSIIINNVFVIYNPGRVIRRGGKVIRGGGGIWTNDRGHGGSWEFVYSNGGTNRHDRVVISRPRGTWTIRNPGMIISTPGVWIWTPGHWDWDLGYWEWDWDPGYVDRIPGRPGPPWIPGDPLPPVQPGDVVTPSIVGFEKYSTVPWDGVNEATRRLNWHYPSNASVISNGDIIEYFITLSIPPGAIPDDSTNRSRFVNVVDRLPDITVRRYEDRFLPDEIRAVVGRTELVDGPHITRSDHAPVNVDSMGFDGNHLYWNFVEVPEGVEVTLSFSVRAEVDLERLTLNRYTQLLIENRAYVNGRRTNSVFHEIARPAIVAEKFVGIVEDGELRWVQSTDWITGLHTPTPDEQIFVNHGQVFPYKISLGNAGFGAGTVMVRDQINSLLRVVEAQIGIDGVTVEAISAIGNRGTIADPRGLGGRLNIDSNNITWLEWDSIRVDPGTAFIHGMLYDRENEADPRTWIHRRNDPNADDTTVSGLNFTITDPVEIIFYVQVIGDPDQGQQIPNHALHDFPYLDINEMAGMGRSNQVDVYVQRTLFVARQESDPLHIEDGASISNSLVRGRVRHGDEITYTVEVANAGGADGYVEIAIPIPEGMTFAGMVNPDDGSLNPWMHPPVVERRTVRQFDVHNVPFFATIDVLVWSAVPVPSSYAGRGLLPDATGQVVIGPVVDDYGNETIYIAIGSVANTHATARLMPWSEAGRTSVTFIMEVSDEMINGSRIDSIPSVVEVPALDFDIPLVNLQPISVYPAVLSHFVPLAEIFGARTARFVDTVGRNIYIGRHIVGMDNGEPVQVDFVEIDGRSATPEEIETIFVDRGTVITYDLTAYNFGLSRGRTYIWSQIPLHTTLLQSSNDIDPDNNNVLLWTVHVDAYDSGEPGQLTKSFTVVVDDDIANGISVENVAMIAGRYTNELVFNTRPPEIFATKWVSVNGGEFINSDSVTDMFGNPGIPVTVGTVVEYMLIVRNIGEGMGLVRIEDQISQLLHNIGNISHGGTLVGNTIIWEDILVEREINNIPGEVRLTFTATVGFDPSLDIPPPEQGTLIPNDAIFNNAKIDDLVDPDIDFGGEIGLGLGRTNMVYLVVQAPSVTATQDSVVEPGEMVLPGDTITYYITINNSGGIDVDVTVVNPIPTGTTLNSNSLSHVANVVDGVITWNLTIAPLEEIVLSFAVTVNNDISNGAQISNAPWVHGRETIPAAIVHHVPLADISGVLEANVYEVTAGDEITYTITLTNTAPVDGTVVVSNQVPAGTNLVLDSIIPSNGQFSNDVIVWDQVVVPRNGGSVQLSFTVTAQNLPNGQIIRSSAHYGSARTNEVTVVILASEFRGVLSAQVNDDPAINTIRYRDEVTYTIRVENVGDHFGVAVVTNQIPNGMTLVPTSISNNGTVDGYGIITWNLPSIPAGEYVLVSYQVRVQMLENGTVVRNNTAIVDGTLANTVDLRVQAPVLTATLISAPPGRQVFVGEEITFTVRLTNNGNAEVATDTYVMIPGGMRFIEFAGDTGSNFNNILSRAEWTNVIVPANSVIEFSYRVEVTGLYNNGTPIREGESMTTVANITNRIANSGFSTNSIVHSFAPQVIYPGVRLQVLGNTRLVNNTPNSPLTFTPSINGVVHGAERTDGFKLGVTIDNIGGSLNTTHVALENYTVRVVMPSLHILDLRTDREPDLAPRFIPIINGVAQAPIPIPMENVNVIDNPDPFAPLSHVVTLELSGDQFRLQPNRSARIELFSQAQLSGNADPLFFTANLIPNPVQDFNRNRVVRGRVTQDGNALEAFASVFIVGVHTTLAHIEVAQGRYSASGNNHENNLMPGIWGENLDYTLVLQNTSPGSYNNVTLIGRMPHINDSVMINANIPRQSNFGIDFVDVVEARVNGVLIPLDEVEIGYMIHLGDFSPNQWNSGAGWQETPPWNQGDVGQSYRIHFPNLELPPNATLSVVIRANAAPVTMTGETAWKSFAFQYRTMSTPIMNLRSEVAVVGVELDLIIPEDPVIIAENRVVWQNGCTINGCSSCSSINLMDGVTAYDPIVDISNLVIISRIIDPSGNPTGEFDGNQVGTWRIEYSVTNEAGVTATKEVTVTVRPAIDRLNELVTEARTMVQADFLGNWGMFQMRLIAAINLVNDSNMRDITLICRHYNDLRTAMNNLVPR
ncbi:MAG: hypothetical protein FWC91_05145, partial [Defluviitaleaceae bacterium]|nr:hypothetical protein [Defluviitaleaceae bacterium]